MIIERVWWGRTQYAQALERMNKMQEDVAAGNCANTIIYTEHESIITCGRNTPPKQIFAKDIPVIEVNRGGLATWHGPGQIIGYPILNLRELAGQGNTIDLHGFLRHIELGIIDFLGNQFGIRAKQRKDFTGVWIDSAQSIQRKIASIGISVRKGVSAHGFALNINCNFDGFATIVPCGLTGIEMTSVARETTNKAQSFEIEQLCPQLHESILRNLIQE